MKIVKPITHSIEVQHRYVTLLKQNMHILNPMFRRVSADTVITYLSALSKAEADLWQQVRTTYPECIGNANLTTSNTEVSWDDDLPANKHSDVLPTTNVESNHE